MARAGAWGLVAALAFGCSTARPDLRPPPAEDDPAARAALVASAFDGHRAAFELRWEGRRIGDARERFFADPGAAGGYRFERVERVVLRRGGTLSSARTVITIDVDAALHAQRVMVVRDAGGVLTRAEARRLSDDGWQVAVGEGPPRLVDGSAVPSSLVPLLVAAGGARGRAFAGPILVEGANLAQATLALEVDGASRLATGRVTTRAGELRSVSRLDDEGHVQEAGLGAALTSRRTDEGSLAAAFDPPDVVGDSALAVLGTPRAADTSGLRVTVDGVAATPRVLGELPGQTVTQDGGAWRVHVAPTAWPQAGTGAWRDVADRVHRVARLLTDDLGMATISADEALAAGRGDCTAHAIVLERDLADAGYAVRLVTGFVLDDGALHRHRWVVVQIGKRWVPVDPMFDEVPAQPTHVALAVHGSSADELAFIDDVVFSPWRGARATYTP